MKNIFFEKNDNVKINNILDLLNIKKQKLNFKVNDIKELNLAEQNDITFFHSKKYYEALNNTKSKLVVSDSKLKKLIPPKIKVIEVKNVLLSVSLLTSLFYPSALKDNFDIDVLPVQKTKFKNLKTGFNVLLGKNIKIGQNCSIGHNSIIEKNVQIGDNCQIGSNSIIRNSLIEDNVKILDNCVIGKKGFGFFPNSSKNIRYPHVGIVIIGENSEIGCGATIDRGSMSNTVIGKNTYIDNQVHIAHNVKIGENSIIAGQVGIAGSTIIGNNVKIGGQAGISGHLKIGNNVQIAGGSGVIKSLSDNSKVMGYPAKNIKEFLRDNK